MRGFAGRFAIVCASAALAAACSTSPPPESEVSSVTLPSGSGVYKIGEPYEEEGVWYYPKEQPDYDETGIASWYGGEFHGHRTANGEIFDANGLTAAHPTLPMPVNVRVTNLENGKSIVLRVNDRGPFKRGRIIDVSQRAAQLLGFYGKGTAKVRVTYLARADEPAGAPADSTTETAVAAAPTAPVQVASLDPAVATPATTPRPQSVSADAAPAEIPSSDVPSPSPEKLDANLEAKAEEPAVVTTVAVPATTHIYVQVGTFAIRDNAERLKDRLSAAGNLTISSIDRKGQTLYRVRVGPFDDVSAADSALAQVNGVVNIGARIVVDQ
ncbi:MAG TPA: septal ring lytic transglycosylase RlpA family protein [Rhizomicrobium sp.]|nr:septal ring lytic transglycosylase RlpA family protein [Rhizomicrobium sp.]